MAIQFVSVKCPECGADLSVEDGREQIFCSYCGAKVMITNDNEHIYRTIDEAGIKQAETERMIRLRELELEEREISRDRRSMLIAYGIALAFVLIGALICIAEPLGGMWGIIIGAYIALFTYVKNDKKKKKRFVSSTEACVTDSMLDYEDKNYNSMVMLFKGAGFTNVTPVPLNDHNMFNARKNGRVEMITINGDDDFEDGDVYPRNAHVVITYHSK